MLSATEPRQLQQCRLAACGAVIQRIHGVSTRLVILICDIAYWHVGCFSGIEVMNIHSTSLIEEMETVS